MKSYTLTDRARMRPLELDDAEPLYALAIANRDRLRPWFPWMTDTMQVTDTRAFVELSVARPAKNDGGEYALLVNDQLAGILGYHSINWTHRRTALGYWLDHRHEGHGLITRGVRCLLDQAFHDWKLHRIEITADVTNTRSRAVPQRLGFTFEGIRKDYMLRHGHFHDEAVYVMLAPDWTALSPP